jgi:hypothetical protein
MGKSVLEKLRREISVLAAVLGQPFKDRASKSALEEASCRLNNSDEGVKR